MALFRKNKDFAYEVTITAGNSEHYDFESDAAADAYAPFKNIQIVNTGSYDLKVYFNGQTGYKLVPKGTIFEREDVSISYLRIENTGAGSATFTMTLDNDVSEKELLKALVLGQEEVK